MVLTKSALLSLFVASCDADAFPVLLLSCAFPVLGAPPAVVLEGAAGAAPAVVLEGAAACVFPVLLLSCDAAAFGLLLLCCDIGSIRG
jgi:hypothetical protein